MKLEYALLFSNEFLLAALNETALPFRVALASTPSSVLPVDADDMRAASARLAPSFVMFVLLTTLLLLDAMSRPTPALERTVLSVIAFPVAPLRYIEEP